MKQLKLGWWICSQLNQPILACVETTCKLHFGNLPKKNRKNYVPTYGP